jgi:hypothetical protein
MRYVKITSEQAKLIPSRSIGVTDGKKDFNTGLRPSVLFCSSLDFVKVYGYDIEREFIEI